jgi:tRNA threonylcarbamoyladenosine biosynthesis protein TsaE
MPSSASPRALRERCVTVSSPAGTQALAQSLGAHLRHVRVPLLLALQGDLGAGKTHFVRGLARGLGLATGTAVPSPTFTIAQRFDLPDGRVLEHIDAYRLGGVSELEAAGLDELCGSGRVTCVEWAGRVAEALPADRLEIELTPCPSPDDAAAPDLPPQGRHIRLRALGAQSAAVLDTWRLPAGTEEA